MEFLHKRKERRKDNMENTKKKLDAKGALIAVIAGVALVLFLGSVNSLVTVVSIINDHDGGREAWVATMSVVAEIANGVDGMLVYSDEHGCAVIVTGDELSPGKKYEVCPGGEVTEWTSGVSNPTYRKNRGGDPYWVNLGRPKKGDEQ